MASQKVWEVLRDALGHIGALERHTATGGSTTTMVDSAATSGDSSAYVGGFGMVLRDAGGAAAAPEGEFAAISGFSAGTWTVGTLTAAVAAGDRFAVTKKRFPLADVIEWLNMALRSLGDIVYVDTTTLDTASNQTEYTQAVDWKRNPLAIDMQTHLNDANDNRWTRIWQVKEVPAAPGSTGLFELPQLASGYDLRVWYKTTHPTVNAYSDSIAEVIHPELAKAALVLQIQKSIAAQRQFADENSSRAANFAVQEFEDAMRKFGGTLRKWDYLKGKLPSYTDPSPYDPGQPGLVRI